MKYFRYVLVAAAALLLTRCSPSRELVAESSIEVTGTVQKQGITSYQYGTHVLNGPETYYALQSELVNLDQYLEQEVVLKAEPVAGYPLSGGPVLLHVLEVVAKE